MKHSKKAINQCLEYSDNPETLMELFKDIDVSWRLECFSHVSFGEHHKQPRPQFRVRVSRDNHEPFEFTYYGSINEGMLHNGLVRNHRGGYVHAGVLEARKELKKEETDRLYSILCCIRSEYYCEPILEDFCAMFGYDEDSMKDFKLWQRCLKQSAGFQKALRLSDEELESLPC